MQAIQPQQEQLTFTTEYPSVRRALSGIAEYLCAEFKVDPSAKQIAPMLKQTASLNNVNAVTRWAHGIYVGDGRGLDALSDTAMFVNALEKQLNSFDEFDATDVDYDAVQNFNDDFF
jgi:hypothetical protein